MRTHRAIMIAVLSMVTTLAYVIPAAAACTVTQIEFAGEPAVVLENDLVRLRVRPMLGGRIDELIYKPTGKSLTSPVDASVMVDRIWNYANRDVYQQWTGSPYSFTTKAEDGTASVTLTGPGSVGIGQRFTFVKTFTITEGSAAIRADHALQLGHEAMTPHRAGIWCHNQLGVPQEVNTYYAPTTQGVQALSHGAGASGEYWWYDIADGWCAAVGESGTGIAAVLEFPRLMCFYQYLHGEIGMMEWAYRSVEIPNGGETTLTTWLVPFAGLQSVAGAGQNLVGEIVVPEKLTDQQAQAGIPITVRLTAPSACRAEVRMGWQALPEGERTALPQWDIDIKPTEVAEHTETLKLGGDGNYGFYVTAMRNGEVVAEFSAGITIGEVQPLMVIRPREKPIGRVDERFEDKIAAATAAPEDRNPSEEIVTPHIKWAKPYSRGPLKTLILNDILIERETVELAQRVDMDYIAPTIGKGDGLGGSKLGQGLTHEQAVANVRKALQGDLDVIVIGGLNGSIFPDDVVELILEKVRGGTGLVCINPNNYVDAMWAALPFSASAGGSKPEYTWAATEDHYLTRGVPLDRMPPAGTSPYKLAEGAQVLAKADRWPLLAVSELGDGRIVCLAYCTSWQGPGSYMNGLTPWIQSAPTKFAYWEYYFSLIAKCMTWAAKREPTLQIASIIPEQEAYSVRGEQPKLLVSLDNAGVTGEVVAHVTVTDAHGHTERRFARAIAATPGQATLDILLPQLPGGMHMVDIMLEDAAGKRLDWGSVALDVTSPVQIAETQVVDEVYRAGDSVTVSYVLTAGEQAPPQLRRLASLTDALGRLILIDEDTVPAADGHVSFRLPEPLTTTATARIEFHDQDGLLCATERQVLMIPSRWDAREWGSYVSGLWGNPAGAYSCEYLQAPASDRTREAGIDVVLTSDRWPEANEHRPAFAAGFPALCIGVTADVLRMGSTKGTIGMSYDEQKEQYVRTKDKQYLQRPWSLDSDETKKVVTDRIAMATGNAARYRPLGYVCGDELSVTYYTRPFDYDFGPPALAAFREWLKTEYGGLAALNAEWETNFATWDEVMPMTAEEVAERGNYAPWADHRTYMEVSYANFFRWTDDTLESHDPGAKLGISGSQAAKAYGGYDWWRLTDALDFLQSYDHENTGEMHRSFHDLVTAPWWGYGARDPSLRHQLWRRLLNGSRGGMYFSYASLLRPDLTFTETAAEGRVHVNEFKSGLAQLLANCDERVADLYVHYSQPSIHGAFITGGESLFDSNRAGWVKAIEDLGLQIRFVSSAQVENGDLLTDMPKAVLLPYSVAISDDEARAFAAYVEAGGTLIADARCGLMDEHCRLREIGALDGLFGVARAAVDPRAKRIDGTVSFHQAWGGCDPTSITFDALSGDTTLATTEGAALGAIGDTPVLIVRNTGTGKSLLLNLFQDHYIRRRGLGVETPQSDLIAQVLAAAGIEPFTSSTSTQPDHFYTTRFRQGAAQYVGVLREPPTVQTGGGPGSASTGTAAVNAMVGSHFGQKAHVYDLRAGRYVGHADAAQKLLQPGECAMYSLLPYKVSAVEVKTRGQNRRQGGPMPYQVLLKTDGDTKPGMHVVRIDVTGPDGMKAHYGRQHVLTEGAAEGEIPLAFNDTIGTWTVTATDIATGTVGTAEFEVVQR